MGGKKRNPLPKPRPASDVVAPQPLAATSPSASCANAVTASAASGRVPDAIKAECEKALLALRRGNHNKALRLMKEACGRHSDSSALLHRVYGTVSVKVAALMDDPNVKLRHLRSAIESAKKAVALSPDSIEFAHFYAHLLYEAASDSKEYEEVARVCERAISIENPIDPAKESLQDESQQKLSSAEARISHIQQELRSLSQKSNIASISTWMKTFGNGEEKFRIIPLQCPSEDPMEVRLVQTPRRPNEIKKATKTPEEQRKLIEVRVAAARLLQQNSSSLTLPQLQLDEGRESLTPSASSSAQRLAERRKLMNVRKLMSSAERMDQARKYLNSITSEKRRSFLEVSVKELKEHHASFKEKMISDALVEALSFAEEYHTWRYWVCCRCHEKFIDAESHLQHVENEHVSNFPLKSRSAFPYPLSDECIKEKINGSWKPIDLFGVVKILEGGQTNCQSVVTDFEIDNGSKDRDKLSDGHFSSVTSNTSVLPLQDDDSNVDSLCTGFSTERRYTELAYCDLDDIWQRFPLSDDAERYKLLERIQGMLRVLGKHKCLCTGHLDRVQQLVVEELRSQPFSSQLIKLASDHQLLSLRLLTSPQLKKVLKYLQDVSHSCGLGRYSETTGDAGTDLHNPNKSGEYLKWIALTSDLSTLLLDSQFFRSGGAPDVARKYGSEDSVDGVDTSALVSWLYAGASTVDQLAFWTRMREEKLRQGIELFQILEKDFYLLQSMCDRKCDQLRYDEALQIVESLCAEEFKNREHIPMFMAQSYDVILRKRRDVLVERENDVTFSSDRLELDAILNVLKEAEALDVNQLGYDDKPCDVTYQLHEMNYNDDADWRMQDHLHQADTCVELAMQRQKEHVSTELGKADARIMRNLNEIELLEHKLGSSLSFDYQEVILPLVKCFMRVHLEDLVDKDATEKSEAAREAFLAELAMDDKKSKGGDCLKQKQEKAKEKRKNKDNRKPKDTKASVVLDSYDEFLIHQQPAEEFSPKVPLIGTNLNQQKEDFRRVELEAEERKLEETLEYQRRMEDEAKQKHLEEQLRRASLVVSENVKESSSHENTDIISQRSLNGLIQCDNSRLIHNGSLVPSKGIDFGNFHFPETVSHNNYANSPTSGSSRQDLYLNNDSRVTFNYREKASSDSINVITATVDQISGLSNGVCPDGNNTCKTEASQSFSAISLNQKTNGTNSDSRKLKIGASQNALFSHASSATWDSNEQCSSVKLSQRSAGSLAGKENHSCSPPQTEACSEEKNITTAHHFLDAENRRKPALRANTLHIEDVNIDVGSDGENGARTLRDLHEEEDAEERFQADLKKAVRQSLDTYNNSKKGYPIASITRSKSQLADGKDVSVIETEGFLIENDAFGAGLKNEVGEYNCFLNVIIQSLWHLRRFRDEFLRFFSIHSHLGKPCIVCALHGIFSALSAASEDNLREPVDPSCLRSSLSNLYPESNFFVEAEMNDASEVLAIIFDCLHQAFPSSMKGCRIESEKGSYVGSWDCTDSACIVHSLFGMNIFEQMNCQGCGLESRHMKYTSFFHNVNANSLRMMKITWSDGSFDELLKLVEMNHQLACDPDVGGCGKANYFHHILSTAPHVFTIVLGWQNACESTDDISATLASINTELDISVLYHALDERNQHHLVSMVCYYGQHYHCFAFNNELEKWFLYDDRTVKVIGGWQDVRSMCERGHLQPQVLFYEAFTDNR